MEIRLSTDTMNDELYQYFWEWIAQEVTDTELDQGPQNHLPLSVEIIVSD